MGYFRASLFLFNILPARQPTRQAAILRVNKYWQLTTGNDFVDQNGSIGGAKGVDSNGKVIP